MKLSEAILKGCEMTPKQAFRWWGQPGVETCAMGAAAEAIGVLSRDKPFCDSYEIAAQFPGVSGRVLDNIFTCNDNLRQSREDIAAWLAGEGL